jgi:FAD-dependent urate hydroxylase
LRGPIRKGNKLPIEAERRGRVAVVGAGPYGLSAAAHLRANGVPTHVLGTPLSYWRTHMPQGMHLKSAWRASTIASPGGKLSLPAFERMRGAPFHRPIPIADFIDYALWYQRRAVPDLDDRRVTRLDRHDDRFVLTLDDGDELVAAHVVLATGLSEFSHRPAPFNQLPPGLVSHTADHVDLSVLEGKRVLVVGAGQSALESAVLAHEAGAQVQLLVRAQGVHWLTRKARLERGLGRWLYANSDVGPVGMSWIVAAPWLMRRLSVQTRRRMIERSIRPACTAWLLPRSASFPQLLGRSAVSVDANSGGAVSVKLDDGTILTVDHVMLGTGFRPSIDRISMLAPELRQAIAQRDGQPILGPGLETSVRGLHIVGALAADSFGPVMRFVSGTWYTAPALASQITNNPIRLKGDRPVSMPHVTAGHSDVASPRG